MNSADQGVYPMVRPFKRRWDFRYIGIDDGEDSEVAIEDEKKRLSDVVVSWVRKANSRQTGMPYVRQLTTSFQMTLSSMKTSFSVPSS